MGREHFEAAHARGKGVFVLTGHYGCWELAGYPLGRWLGTLYIVARPQNNPLIAAHFEQLRESNGNVQIDRGRAGTRMLKVLKRGGAIGVAIDQRVRPSQALLVPFLRLAESTSLATLLVFALVNLSLLRLRRRRVHTPGPHVRVPLLVPVIGIATCLLMMAAVALR